MDAKGQVLNINYEYINVYSDTLEQEYEKLCKQKANADVVCNPRISIVWWNTSLDPYKRKRKENKGKTCTETLQSIKKLLVNNDLLVLGEFTDSYGLGKYIAELNLKLSYEDFRERYNMIDLNYCEKYKDKNNINHMHEFHNAIIYKRSSFVHLPEEPKCMTCNLLGAKHYRVYQCVKFQALSFDNNVFQVFVVHWSMRDSKKGDAEKRDKYDAAMKIRERMKEDEHLYPYQIVVGDFNCEMYEDPFAKLESSRSVEYAIRNGGLYNPFWRCVGNDVGSISDKGNQSFLCDEPFFDGILVNRNFVAKDGNIKLFPRVIDDIKPFKQGNHRPLQLVIGKGKV